MTVLPHGQTLAANLSMFDVRDQVLNWTISDGLNTISSSCLADASAQSQTYADGSAIWYSGGGHFCSLVASFSTESNGVITEWDVHGGYGTSNGAVNIWAIWRANPSFSAPISQHLLSG